MGPKRYAKATPGHRVQVDVKFLIFRKANSKVKPYQYTAIDDCTRIRALKVYERHNQQNAIDFIDCVVQKFPFRIHTIQTDNGHEFQSKFNWHVKDLGMNHIFIQAGKPQHNGNVERSHLSDKKELYNYNRPHGAHHGKTPY